MSKAETRKRIMEHVKVLEAKGIAGDLDAIKSLACLVLMAEGMQAAR